MTEGPTWLGENETHCNACHKRWTQRLNRRMYEESYKEEWRRQQCFACIYFIGLVGTLKDDWGACSNSRSPFDGRVMFEHDGCECYVEDNKYWDGLSSG